METVGFSLGRASISGFKSAKIVTDRTRIGLSVVVRVRKCSISCRFLSADDLEGRNVTNVQNLHLHPLSWDKSWWTWEAWLLWTLSCVTPTSLIFVLNGMTQVTKPVDFVRFMKNRRNDTTTQIHFSNIYYISLRQASPFGLTKQLCPRHEGAGQAM